MRKSVRVSQRVQPEASGQAMTEEERRALSKKKENKRKKFNWLARFLSKRPPRAQLVSQGVIQDGEATADSGKSGTRIFGTPLDQIYARPDLLKDNVPLPVYYCTEAIQKFLDLEGIFRVSGTFSEMKSLTQAFENGSVPDLSKVDNPHSISGLFEKFFQELPQPVTTWVLYDDFMEAADKTDEREQTEHLKQCLRRLPTSNRTLLSYFLVLMKKISRHSAVNKMGEKNLGVVFGSIVLGPENLLITLADKQKLQNQNVVVEKLITHVYQLFPELKDKDELYSNVPAPLPALGGNKVISDAELEKPPPMPQIVFDGVSPPLYAPPPPL